MKLQHSFNKQTFVPNIKNQILLAFLCLFTASCTDNNMPQTNNSDMGSASTAVVRFTVSSSEGPLSVSSTRSQMASECQISDMQVLVFENGIYTYKVQGAILNNNSHTTIFEAPLQSSTSTIKLYFIANMSDFFLNHSLPENGSESDIKALITASFSSAGLVQDLPMFGQYTFEGGIVASNNNVITDIKMLRSIARIDVLKDSNVANFELKTIQVFRANNSFQVVPNEALNTSQPIVTTPSIPAEATATVNTNSINVSGNSFMAQLYIPEAAAIAQENRTDQATCIVIGGVFESEEEITFYRIDFQNEEYFGQILRNYHYVFQIKEVKGAGKSTATDAANNPSANITTLVEKWDANQTNMVFDSSNHLGYSTQKVSLKFRAGSTETIDINTNLTNYLLQWSDMDGIPLGEGASTTIENELFKVEIPNGENENGAGVDKNSQIRISSKQDNKTDIPQSGYFIIVAGGWNIRIEIRQESSKGQSDCTVNILSAGTSYGSFGGTFPEKVLTGYAAAFKAILQNTDNFGPTGTIPLNYIAFDYTSGGGTVDAFRWFLERFDIINVGYSSGLSTDEYEAIADWLEAKDNRVLFVTRDNTSTNTALITRLCGETTMWSGGGTTGRFNFAGYTTGNDYFTQSGPFGEISPDPASFSFAPFNGTWLGIAANNAFATDLTPLLTSSTGGEYVISVDKKRRIVYLAQSRLYQVSTGWLTNSGEVNTDQSRLIANLWAWAIEKVVLSGKLNNNLS